MKARSIVLTAFASLAFMVIAALDASADQLAGALAKFENDEHGDLHSVIVLQGGETLAEHYYNGGDAQTLVDIRSAGKSVTSLLFGIAVDQGLITDLEQPVEQYWTEAAGSPVGAVRLSNLLTMRSGLAADADVEGLPGNEDFMDEADDPLAFALSIPVKEPQGTRYRYNSLAAYVAGIVISRASGDSLEEFARANLFAPLGMQAWDWQEDRAGQTKGQGNLFLTARDFAHMGEMVLKGGVCNGKQVVSSGWIEESLRPRVDISANDPFADGYGYFWYSTSYDVGGHPTRVFFASGNGGNKIYVIPDLKMVVSVMSRAYGQRWGQRRSETILKAVLDSVAAP